MEPTTSIQRVIGFFCLMMLSSWILFAQPSNNNPCGAIPLPVSNGCILVEGTNVNATSSAINPKPSCGNYKGGDVWYVVQVPSTGNIVINTKAKQLSNMTMAAYAANSCTGPFTQIACAEDGSTFDYLMPKLTINNRPPGSYVFIRIFDHVCNDLFCGPNDPHQRGTFEICATIGIGNVTSTSNPVSSYTCNTTPPAGNTCETATPICTFDGYCGSTFGYTANYWHSGSRGLGGAWNAQGIFCGSIENNSFIKFVAGASDVQLQVIISGSSTACDEGVQFMMFGNPTGGPVCQSLDIISHGCESPMPRGTNTFNASGLNFGQEYYLMVDGFAGDRCDYQINAVFGVLIRMSAGKDRTICLGETATLSVFGAGAGSIDWTGPYLNANSGQTVTATPTTTGTFQYIVDAPTLNPACVGQARDKDTVLVTVISPMGNIGLVQSGGGCSSGTVTLTASGGNTYTWTPTNGLNVTTGAVVTASPTVNTTYTVKASNSSGCPSTNSITVTATGGPALTVSATKDTICTGGTGTVLTASPGFTSYSWSPTTGLSPTSGATVTANPASAGNYTYTVTGTIAGCPNTTATKTITVISGAAVSVTPANPTICNGQSVTLTASPAGNYNWTGPGGFTQNGVGAITVSPTSNATYTATGISCPSSGSATVNVTSLPPALTAVNGSRCGTGTVGLSVTGACAGTINWYATNVSTTSLGSGSSFTTPSISATTTYYASCTVGSCEGPRVPVVATINTTLPNANAGPAGALTCAVSSVQLSGSSTTPGVTYSWSGPGIVSGGNTATPTVNAAGTYTLTVTNPATGCTNTAQTTVSSSGSIPNASAGTNKTLTCTTSTVVLDGSSATAGSTFSWSGPGIVSGGNTATPTVNAVGTYTLTVTDPSNGCTNTAQVTVSSNTTLPNADAGSDKTLTCTASAVTLDGSSSTAGATFSWSGPGIVSGGSTATPTVNANGTYTLTVTNPANGCTSTDQVNISSNTTPPNASAGSDKSLTCVVSSITLDGSSSTPGATFSWSGPGIVSGGSTTTPTVNVPGVYILTVTNPANGCTNSSQASVSIDQSHPQVDAGGNRDLTCAITSIVLNGSSTTPGATFSWSGPGIVSGGNTATPTVNAPGTYILTVINPANGCDDADHAIVTLTGSPPEANAGGDKTLTCSITSVTLDGSSATPGATFSWSGPGVVSGGNTATPTINASGTYTLTVTDPANGCTATDQVSVNANTTSPNVNAGGNQTLPCGTNSITLTGSSSTPGVTFSWSGPGIVSGGNTATPTINVNGTYILTVTNPANGCTVTDQAVVTGSGNIPDANAGSDKTLNCTISSVTLDGSSTTPGTTFSWSGPGIVSGGNTATPSVNSPGTYTLTVTDPSNGCTNTAQATVTANTTSPAVNAGNDKTLTCTVTSDVLDGSTSTPGATFSWSGSGIVSGGNTATPMVNAAGTYTLTVTDPANGCTAADQVSVNANTTAPNVNAGGNQTLPCGANSITLSGSSSTSGVSFSWSGPGIISGGNTTTPTINANGTYILTVTNPANGCTATDQAVVTGSGSIPDANAGSGKTLTCTISSVTLDGSSTTPGTTFSWSGPGIASGGNTATPTVNAQGAYTLTVTDPANGCTNTAQVTVTANTTLPEANAGGDKTLTCTVTSVTLDGSSATPGATFSWNGPGIVSGGNTATPTANATGTYTLTVTDPVNGCINTDQVSVSQDIATPDASIAAPGDLDCITTTLTLIGSSVTAGATFSWIGPGIISGGNTASPTIGQAGTYTLTVTNPANGCVNTASVTVNNIGNLPDINIATPNLITCAVTQVTLSGSSATSGVTFSWSGPGIVSGGNTATPVVNVTGSYTLTVTNPANNCVATDDIVVISDLVTPVIDMVTPNEINCVEAAVVLSAFGNVSNPGYAWTGPGIVSGANTTSPLVNAAGNYTVTVTNLDNGCSDNANVTVISTTTPPQIAIATPGTLTCTTTSLDLQGSSTTPGVIFSWSGPGVVSGGNTATPTINAPGTYTLTVTDPANGCTNTAQVSVTASTNAPVANAGTDKILTCTVTLVTLNGSSATPGATFAWSGPGITSGGSTATPTVNAPGTYTLTVTNPANSCTATDNVIVTNSTNLPDADAGPDQIIDCRASSVQLQGSSNTPGVTVLWSGSGITGGANTFTPTVNAAGTYTMTVTNPANGCVSSDVVTVRVAEPLSISADITPNPCAQLSEGAIEITVEGGVMPYTFTWSNGSSSQSLAGITGGQYDLTVTDSTGCREELSYTVPQDIFELVAFYDSTINLGESIQLFGIVTGGSGEEVFAWSPPDYLNCTDCEDPLSTPLQNIVYFLTVTDTKGCSYTDSILIKVNQFFDLYIPNAFTPNNDGVNDQFVVLGDTENVQTFRMWVFNRWQEMLYYTEDIEDGWDGTYKSTDQPLDVYTYAIQVTFSNGKSENYKGYIVLIR